MFVKSYASTLVGIDAIVISVEVNISAGIGMFLVGLPDNAVKESQERIRSAFENSGFRMTGKRTIVNLAPADLRKEGSGYDLPIALSILAASGQIVTQMLENYIIMGELSLDGSIMPIKGALPIAIKALKEGFRGVILPKQNATEAAVVEGLEVIGVESLRECVDFLCDKITIEPTKVHLDALLEGNVGRYEEDFSDVKGQQHVKRALEIAAAGGHNVLMIGSPGSGKTMLARRMPSIMPLLTLEEALETTKIHSVAGKLGVEQGLILRRPFRAPHHLTSQVALVGGGTSPQPGEISLAHNGILFMDELPEFGRSVLEVLRQPLEERRVTVSRAKYSVEYPANFILIASMNPCPCGYYNHPKRECTCSAGMVQRYMSRISGPLLDRIDMHVEVTPVEFREMSASEAGERSELVRERIMKTREVQQRRFASTKGIYANAMMNSKMLKKYAPLSAECVVVLERAMSALNLSARAYDRIVKLARTIADMQSAEQSSTQALPINPSHIAEAINYRSLDREGWGV